MRHLLPPLAAAIALLVLPGRPAGAWEAPPLAAPTAGERLLIVAPHIDDEAIAAAGYAAAVRAAGGEVFVAYLTSGDGNRFAAALLDRTWVPRARNLLHEGEVRIGEARVAMGRLGIAEDHLFFLGYPDRGLAQMLARPWQEVASRGTTHRSVPYAEALSPGAQYRLGSLERDLRAILLRTAPTLVMMPLELDRHGDHAAAGRIVRRVLAQLPEPPRSLGYLVHATGFPRPLFLSPRRQLLPPVEWRHLPWRSFPLTAEQVKLKWAVLHSYRSQIRNPYLRLLLDGFVRRNELFVEQ